MKFHGEMLDAMATNLGTAAGLEVDIFIVRGRANGVLSIGHIFDDKRQLCCENHCLLSTAASIITSSGATRAGGSTHACSMLWAVFIRRHKLESNVDGGLCGCNRRVLVT